MKIIVISLFIGILLIVFLISSLLIYTIYFDKEVVTYIDDLGYSDLIKSAMIYSGILLTTFIIAYANYSIKLNGKNNKNEMLLGIGLFFIISIIGDILISYYMSIKMLELSDRIFYPREVKANNNISVASNIYYLYGVEIEYYDFTKTKKKYKPSEGDLSLRKLRNSSVDEIHRTPIYITIAFILLICSFYFSNLLASKRIEQSGDR